MKYSLILVLFGIGALECKLITNLDVPNVIEEGTKNLTMECLYEVDPKLSISNISSVELLVKWFLNNSLISQWIYDDNLPDNPSIANKFSGDFECLLSPNPLYRCRTLRLMNPSFNLSGTYKCQVNLDTDEDIEEKNMLIYVPIEDVNLTYVHDEEMMLVNVSCSASGAYPQPSIIIMANNEIPLNNESITIETKDNLYDINAVYTVQEDIASSIESFNCTVTIPDANFTVSNYTLYSGYNNENSSVPVQTNVIPEKHTDSSCRSLGTVSPILFAVAVALAASTG